MADVGNTRTSAKRIFLPPNFRAFRESLNSKDTVDYYRFTAQTRSSLDLRLAKTAGGSNFDLELLNRNGRVIARSRKAGNRREDIFRNINPGVYFIRVLRRAGSSSYRLLASRNDDNAGPVFELARGVNVGQSVASFQDFVGLSDPNDYYTFSLGAESTLDASLTGLIGSADFTLFDVNRTPIGVSTGSGTSNRTFQGTLGPGTYYINVSPAFLARTQYTLNLSATPTSNPGGGGTTVDAGSDTITGAPDLQIGFTPRQVQNSIGGGDPVDYFKFVTTVQGDLNITLNGLSADADIALFDSNQSLVTFAGGFTDASDEVIAISGLPAGEYYVGVIPSGANASSPATNYTLTVSINPADNVGNGFDEALLITTPGTPGFDVLTDGTTATYGDFAGGTDRDFFKLELTEPRNFLGFKLLGAGGAPLQGSLNILLYNPADPDTLTNPLRATSSGSTFAVLEGSLGSGTYYVEVQPASPDQGSLYNLEVSLDSSSLRPTITRDVFPGGDALAERLTAVGNSLFFVARDNAAGGVGLWKSQGSLDNTVKVGAFDNITATGALGSGTLYFAASTATNGSELWKWENSGGPSGTVSLVADIAPGTENSAPTLLKAAGNNLYFTATPDGTPDSRRLYVLKGGAVTEVAGLGDVPSEIVYVESTDTLFFRAGGATDTLGDPIPGTVLWRISNASSATPGTPTALTGLGGADASLNPRFVSNLKVVKYEVGGTEFEDLFFVAGSAAANGNLEVRRLKNPGGGSEEYFVYDLNGSVTDGSVSGDTTTFSLAVAEGYAYFEGRDSNGEELWRVNLNTGVKEELNEILPGSLGSSEIRNLTVLKVPTGGGATKDVVFFTANNQTDGTELWYTDPTAGLGVTQFDIFTGSDGVTPNSSSPSNLVVANSRLYFAATTASGGRELWSYDGVAPAPEQVIDIRNGANSSNPLDLIAVGDLLGDGTGRLFFTADDGTRGREVWSV